MEVIGVIIVLGGTLATFVWFFNKKMFNSITDPSSVITIENVIELRYKKMHQDAIEPSYSLDGDACMDLTAVSISTTGKYIEYDTGIAFEIPRGYVGLLFPRSSVTKKDLILKNSVGVIDSGFRSSVKVRYYLTTIDDIGEIYSVGDRVGQLMIIPIPFVKLILSEELNQTIRGNGGYGSTGN